MEETGRGIDKGGGGKTDINRLGRQAGDLAFLNLDSSKRLESNFGGTSTGCVREISRCQHLEKGNEDDICQMEIDLETKLKEKTHKGAWLQK